MIYPLPGSTIITNPAPRRDVRFGLHLDEESRERLDRLAALQGVSRTTIIARSLRLLESVQERGVRR